jgi:hypothetical protein
MRKAYQSPHNATFPPSGHAKVIRGGPYLCHHSYCERNLVAARSSNPPTARLPTQVLGAQRVTDVAKIRAVAWPTWRTRVGGPHAKRVGTTCCGGA